MVISERDFIVFIEFIELFLSKRITEIGHSS